MRAARTFILALAALTALAAVTAACGGKSDRQPLIVYEARGTGGSAGEYTPTATQKATNVYTIDPKTGESKMLTSGDGYDGSPGWSPDFKQIVFASDRAHDGRRQDIYVMNADGSDPRQVTDDPDKSFSPRYSHDGSRIAYVRVSSDGYYLSLISADGTGERQIAGAYKFAEFPAWTPDDKQIYFAAIEQTRNDIDIYSIDLDTLAVQLRISTPNSDVCPHFTHDGNTLTYASVAPGADKSNVDLFAHDLSSDDTSGAHDVRLTDNPGVDDYGNPAPDDKTFVFLSNRDGNPELYLMDRDGKNQRRLTTTPDVAENVPDW